MLTVLGIWGGPYLYDVHGLDGIQRGNVLLAMAVAQIVGILAYGPMDRLLRSRKKVVLGGAVLSMAMLALMALLARPPLWLAVVLLVALCFFCAFATVIVAQGRSLFPDHLAGRHGLHRRGLRRERGGLSRGVRSARRGACRGRDRLPALARQRYCVAFLRYATTSSSCFCCFSPA